MAVTREKGVSTPYTTVFPYVDNLPDWVKGQDAERIAAYKAYQDMYFSEDDAFDVIRRDQDGSPVYVPRPKQICDTTAYYLLKDMTVGLKDPDPKSEIQIAIDTFCKREKFYSKFNVAKLAGVVRGDFVMHLTADPFKPEGSRLSINSVDPASYFPEVDDDDIDRRIGVKLVTESEHPDDATKTVLHILHYWYNLDEVGNRSDALVQRDETMWEVADWQDTKKRTLLKTLVPAGPLPSDISQIPVYHFPNASFDGFEFGSSELKGVERLFLAIDQAISDEEISLALVGLGVYATDAGRPKNSQGKEVDWIVAPGTVWEMPGATMVKRLEGITTVQPVLEHVAYLEQALYAATQTSDIELGNIDAQTAESPVALAIKFIPTLAKVAERDIAGVETLTQMWYDWKFFFKAYEGKDYTATEIVIRLGDKLPINRTKVLEELNYMADRKIISKKFYRDECTRRLGYVFPEDIEQQILDEQTAQLELTAQFAAPAAEGAAGGNPQQQIGPGGRKVGANDTLPKSQTTGSNNKSGANASASGS